MKLGTETGSLINHIIAAPMKGEPAPVVGLGCTLLYWSDRKAATVIEVSASGKTIKVQLDTATRTDKHGMSDCQSYAYAPDPNGPVYTFRKTKLGRWKSKGQYLRIGVREQYYDFSF